MSNISSLQHRRKSLPGGGQVVVLETGAQINPESEAMLQALHSRSTDGIDGHLTILEEKGSEKFMSTFYVGYGHKSIGDCGSATVFIEGVSMLAAKAIQDWKLYSGQESSTRYIDFARQAFVNPAGNDAGTSIHEAWREFYLRGVALMKEKLEGRFPIQPEEKEAVYKKAIAARAFDIMRGFLPAGATTNLAWHGNLRQFADKLTWLRHHPLPEVQTIAHTIEETLLEAFPNSFSTKRYDETEAYTRTMMQEHYYYHDASSPDFALVRNSIDAERLRTERVILETRPPKTELPKWIGLCGELEFAFTLDFGSFRDLQRHRAITQRMPLLTSDLGFMEWYLEELEPELRADAQEIITHQKNATDNLSLNPEEKQYYLPMGYKTSNRFCGDLPSLVYLVELRATRFVHQTLRKRAQQMARALTDTFGDTGLVVHLDADPDRFDVKRGEHDIILKPST